MPSAFISYRRTDSAALATLIAVRLKEAHGIDAYVDTRNTDGGGPFPDRLRGAIERMDVFVCLLGATTLDSAWVQIEIEHAHNLRKTMIPVFQERYIPPSPIPNEHVEALLQSDGVQFLDVRNLYIDQAIAQLAEMISNSVPRPVVVPAPPPTPPIYRRFPVILALLALVIAILALSILSTLNQPLSTATLTNVALNQADTSAPTLTPSPTLEIAFIVQTLDSEATIEQATLDVQSTAAARATAYAVGTQSLLDQTATAINWTATPTPNITASIEAYRTQQAATVTTEFETQRVSTARAQVVIDTAPTKLVPFMTDIYGYPVETISALITRIAAEETDDPTLEALLSSYSTTYTPLSNVTELPEAVGESTAEVTESLTAIDVEQSTTLTVTNTLTVLCRIFNNSAASINVRAQASVKGILIGNLPVRASAGVLRQDRSADDGRVWYYIYAVIEGGSEIKGWVRADTVTPFDYCPSLG